ncbi:MAG: ethanolamine ammonia-lyase subunit EutB [Flavobacteriales bacterium]|nr:ethanolamine ammonia-lyase subunit EutB [Flavobacteriales bacterium]MDP4817989.1 ethanolamine ammonia-lyase subunit EutB [Flavobacteriales bacterium]
MERRDFLSKLGMATVTYTLVSGKVFGESDHFHFEKIEVPSPLFGEDLFQYIQRQKGSFDVTLYRQLLGAANEFKEGDEIAGIAAASDEDRLKARMLLAETSLDNIRKHSVFTDEQSEFIEQSTRSFQETESGKAIGKLRMREFKELLLLANEAEIKTLLPYLTSDIIACVVKLMSNQELIDISSKIFHPLPGTQMGSKGYMSARVQPNSPTDNIEDIVWQVFDAWSYSVGDLVLGNNPVSSYPESVAKIEMALYDLLTTFKLENTLSHSVLAHIDIQAEVEKTYNGQTGMWFQSIAGTVKANQTFDVTLEKLKNYAKLRTGKFGLYAETGQGADETNGHGEGFDMLIHESRKYGLWRGLKQQLNTVAFEKPSEGTFSEPWVHLNDVAGFIGPEVFRTKEQLVRCCLEDLVMGKLHGLMIGLDICTTLHMDVSLDDLDWCIDQIMPANPGYLMALPTKNDPMLSYLTTSFSDHLRIREKFGYKINDAMWAFFKQMEIIGENNKPSAHFGDPVWMYYQYRKLKGDSRTIEEIYAEGQACIARVRERGVPIASGYGASHWDMNPDLEQEIRLLYADAKKCLWEETPSQFGKFLPHGIAISTLSKDRKDYIYHPQSGEQLSRDSIYALEILRSKWKKSKPDIQVIVSDGLNVSSIIDEGHLLPYVQELNSLLKSNYTLSNDYSVCKDPLFIQHGRVRAGYRCGELLFGDSASKQKKCILHIIGERPGTMHHNYSVYITVAKGSDWNVEGKIDHDITRVISGISDTALHPKDAAKETLRILTSELFKI